MSFRVTTGMAMNTYRYNLQNSTKRRDDSANKVMTHRNFNSYAEDPSSATYAWRLRRAYSKNDSYTVNNSDTLSRIRIGWETLGTIKTKLYDEAATTAELRGRNDPTADGRDPLGQVLRNTAQSVVQAMNSAKYGDHFVFGGDDALNAPFTWSDDMKTLYYRGVNVNAGLVEKPGELEEPDWIPSKPIYADPNAKAWSDYYKDPTGAAKPTTGEPTWIDDAVTAGTLTADQAQAWKNYYADPENAEKPEGEPDWIPATAENRDTNKEAWVDYYNHVTDAKPSDADPTNTDPGWVQQKPVEIYANPEEKEWSDYYTQNPPGTTKPTTAEPNWIAEGAKNAVADGTKSQAQADEWVAYYADPANVPKPSDADPTNTEPDWIPASATERDTKAEVKAEAWVDYYNHVTDEKPTVPVPDWAKDPADVDEFGVPNKLNDPSFKPADEDEEAWAAYYKDQGDVKRLEKMANEVVNVDLGMGLMENDKGRVVNGTAFNMALPGIQMLGYGVDEDGDPKNGVMLMVRLGEILDGYDPETDSFDPPENEAEYDRLINKFNDARDYLIDSYSDVDTKGQFLEANATNLKDQKDYLAEEVLNLEQVDLADAITEFSWDYYCYSAALKIGTQLLSQSLIDYMR